MTDILATVPESAGSFAPAAEALGAPIHEGVLGDPQLNGEHLVGHVGIQDILSGKLSDDIVRAAERSENPGVGGLSHVEKAVNKHSDLLDSNLDSAFNGNPENPEEKTPEPDQHKELTAQMSNLANNPIALIDHLDGVTKALHAVAPQIASSVQQTATRAIQFLASKVASPEPNVLGGEHIPSQTEISHFNRYLGIVENPTSALKQIKNGTLTSETTEVLANVFPRLYDKMKQAVIGSLNPETPYRLRMMMSQFLGEPLDSSMSFERVQSLQNSFSPAQNPQSQTLGGTKAPKKSLSKLDLADRTSLKPKDED